MADLNSEQRDEDMVKKIAILNGKAAIYVSRLQELKQKAGITGEKIHKWRNHTACS